MSEQKDWWDKAEILFKGLLPIAAVVGVAIWEAERSKREVFAQMSAMAISVLQEPVDNEKKPIAVDPLRDWAISVLQHPSSTPTLTEEAADQLRQDGLPFWLGHKLSDIEKLGLTNKSFDKMFEPFNERMRNPTPDKADE